MRKISCNRLFEEILGEITKGNGEKNVPNIAVRFMENFKIDGYDFLTNEEFNVIKNECEELIKYWDDQLEITYFELFEAVLKKMCGDKSLIKMIAANMSEVYSKSVNPFAEDGNLFVSDESAGYNIVDAMMVEDAYEREKDELEFSAVDFADNNMKKQKAFDESKYGDLLNYTPKETANFLSERIYGQEDAIKSAAMLLYNHMNGHKRNILFAGPTGCGKTEIWRVLSELYPYIIMVDSTMITMEGWSGSFKLRDIFEGMDRRSIEKSIIVMDEFDKFCEPIYGSQGTNYSISQQNELLKLIEGAVIKYPKDKNHKGLEFDSSSISFVFCGSFESLIKHKGKAENRSTIGFGRNVGKVQMNEIYENEIAPEDLVKYAGVRQEIAGRVSQVVQLYPMTEDDFAKILRNEKISPISKIEKEYNVKLKLSKDTEKEIIATAYRTNMGVRYLRNMIQQMFDQQMFQNVGRHEYVL